MKKLLNYLILFFTSFSISAQTLYFPPNAPDAWDTISPSSLGWCPTKLDSLYAYLDSNNTKAFVLLKDGKIVLEKYFGTHTDATPWQWASAGKTITSFMVGVAQQEGYVSIDDTTSTYLGPAWTSCTSSQEEKINIRHQLTMTSGLDDGVMDPFCTIDSCLIYKADAGTRWSYHNGPYTLLDKVIENATGNTLNNYTTLKLKNPTGMTGAFFPVGSNNVFFSNARSMARFGLLILNKGNWNGTQIMTDTAYFNQMVNTSQTLNTAYGYLWWLNGKSNFMVPGSQIVFPGSLNSSAPSDMIVAMGKDGQFLNVVPSQNLVWIRMGNSSDALPVPFLLNDSIWKRINDLECTTSIQDDLGVSSHIVELYPNPCQEVLNISSSHTISSLEVYSQLGHLLYSIHPSSNETTISIKEYQVGLYYVKTSFKDGDVRLNKLIKY